jgi:hypothetical protein
MALPGRPLSTLGPTFSKMGNAAARANVEAVERSTHKLGAVVNAEGVRHRIRGRRGNKVPLGAKTDVRGFSSQTQGLVVTGAVRGIPEGFWHIVEYGSGPHLIWGRGRSGRGLTPKGAMRRYESGDPFNTTRPISTPWGPRQFVYHKGHGSQGTPWATSMRIGAPMVANEMQYEQQRALTKAFVQSL